MDASPPKRPLGSALLAGWMALSAILFSLAALLLIPFPLRVRHRIVGKWNDGVIAAARTLCGLGWRVEGLERLPPPPFVILSNHQSAWETIGFHIIFPRLSFVTKRSLLFIPFFGWGLAVMGPITIDRSKARQSLLKIYRQGRDRADRGFSVVVFPEGTRKPPGRPGKYSKGGAWLAKRLSLNVVPVAVNSGVFWPRNAFIKRSGVITVSVGEPISTTDRQPEEVTEEARKWIQAEQGRLEKEACA